MSLPSSSLSWEKIRKIKREWGDGEAWMRVCVNVGKIIQYDGQVLRCAQDNNGLCGGSHPQTAIEAGPRLLVSGEEISNLAMR